MLLHSYTGSQNSWTYRFPAFTEAGYRVIAPAMRGAYGTIAVPTNLSQLVDNVVKVLDALNIERAHVVATAFGGAIAIRLALWNPEHLKTLKLSCSVLGVDRKTYLARENIVRAAKIRALPETFKEPGASYRHSNPAGTAMWAEIERESASTSGSVVATIRASPDYEALKKVSTPVRLIYGDQDLQVPPTAACLLH